MMAFGMTSRRSAFLILILATTAAANTAVRGAEEEKLVKQQVAEERITAERERTTRKAEEKEAKADLVASEQVAAVENGERFVEAVIDQGEKQARKQRDTRVEHASTEEKEEIQEVEKKEEKDELPRKIADKEEKEALAELERKKEEAEKEYQAKMEMLAEKKQQARENAAHKIQSSVIAEKKTDAVVKVEEAKEIQKETTEEEAVEGTSEEKKEEEKKEDEKKDEDAAAQGHEEAERQIQKNTTGPFTHIMLFLVIGGVGTAVALRMRSENMKLSDISLPPALGHTLQNGLATGMAGFGGGSSQAEEDPFRSSYRVLA